MNIRLLLIGLLFLACGHRNAQDSLDQRFRQSMRSASEIGSLIKLTDDNRNIYPVFSPGDSIIFYQRLLLTDAEDTIAYFPEDRVKPYGMNIRNRDMYILSGAAAFPSNNPIDIGSLPLRYGEETVYGIKSPDSNIIAFETAVADSSGDIQKKIHWAYLAMRDSIRQISFGKTSVFLDRFSNTGRYLTAVYNTGPTWLLIFDLKTGNLYKIDHDSNFVDYLTNFSPDDSLMAFIRSDKRYRFGHDFFGDIWLFKFNK